MPPNKNKTLDEDIFSNYKKIYESTEERLAPEYQVHSHETLQSGEGDTEESHTSSVTVTAVYVKGGENPSIIDSCKITPEDWCPECCINELLDHEGEHILTADDMNRDYKVAIDNITIFIEKNDRSEYFIFVRSE